MAELTDIGVTPLGLEIIERIDAEHGALTVTVADGEARLSEWSGGPSSDAILDYYCSIRDAVTGRITNAEGPRDVAAALADVFSGLWVELSDPDVDGERTLRAHSVLRRSIHPAMWCPLPAGQPIRFDDPIPIGSGFDPDYVLPPLPKVDSSHK